MTKCVPLKLIRLGLGLGLGAVESWGGCESEERNIANRADVDVADVRLRDMLDDARWKRKL